MPLVLPSESDMEIVGSHKSPSNDSEAVMASRERKDGSIAKGKRLERSELLDYKSCLCMLSPVNNKNFQRRLFTLAVVTTPMSLTVKITLFTLLRWTTTALKLNT